MRPWTFRGYKGGYKGAIRDARTIQHDMHALRRALVALLQASANGSRQSVASGIAILADAKDPMREALAAAGVFPPLVAMLGDGTAEERAAAAEALWKLSRNASNKAAIAGAIVTLVALVRGSRQGERSRHLGESVERQRCHSGGDRSGGPSRCEAGGWRTACVFVQRAATGRRCFHRLRCRRVVDIKSVLSLGFVQQESNNRTNIEFLVIILFSFCRAMGWTPAAVTCPSMCPRQNAAGLCPVGLQ